MYSEIFSCNPQIFGNTYCVLGTFIVVYSCIRRSFGISVLITAAE